MKIQCVKFPVNLLFLMVMLSMGSCAAKKWVVPPEFVGHWKSDMTKITVRTEPKWMKFNFNSGITRVEITIDTNKTASGFIGEAPFSNGVIRKNGGDPQKTGVAYIIQCGSIGKIFPEDPLEQKKVELWLGPVEGHIDAGLRYTEGNAQFPMAHLKLRKLKK